jgi:hypothetical protein
VLAKKWGLAASFQGAQMKKVGFFHSLGRRTG